MSLAELVITSVMVEGRSKSEVARDYKISRYWVQQLLKRYKTEGEAAFTPRSRRPHTSPQAISLELEDQIIRLRKRLSKKGLDAGAETIRAHLATAGVARLPAVSTIWRVLARRGFITPQPNKRPKSAGTRFCADLPNERWQADVTHWRLADGTSVEIHNLLDDHSRLALRSKARITTTGPDVLADFRAAFRRHGIPRSVLTDNGAIYTGKPRRGGRVAIEIELDLLGVRLHHSRPYHPQTQGKVERFHQTMKKWLAAQPPARTIVLLQRQLDRFVRYYNTVRPHRALDRHTPAQAYTARTKATPAKPSIGVHHRVRRDKVDTGGVITIRYDSQLRHIGLGRQHAGTRVLALIADRYIRIVNAQTGQLLRELTLDPTRDYQPRNRTPGPRKTRP
ncbi:IS481 family transposase [Segeticoccus rhizosphaerae]|jgi:transposase InsO family protein|uniref:IS481 family transposase n=1 Tax=Segeticoccus rhizosphaerae TaxID=1104777 RepID=UPI0010C0324C|nr:IS481 family transposase [Ornithinicoccus soli]